MRRAPSRWHPGYPEPRRNQHMPVPVDEPDPLYEPTSIAFVYAAWAGASWLVSNRVGLLVLVTATAILTGLALRHDREPEPQRFITDFAVVLLFCATAIASGILVAGASSG